MRLELSTMRATTPTTGTLMSQWRVGAIVEAMAMRGADDQLWLQIGALRVPARIASGDAAGPVHGERLQLRVLRDSPVIALETLASDASDAAALNEGLRRFLPRQSSAAPLFANLAWLAQRGGGPLNATIAEAAQKLWRAVPDAEQLRTPEGLQNALRDSGAFLESRLANDSSSQLQQTLGRDLKALLSVFKHLLARAGGAATHTPSGGSEPLPSMRAPLAHLPAAAPSLDAALTSANALNELASQTDGALARLNTLQLVNAEANASAAWLFELPVRRDGQPETVRFRFERNGRDARSGEQDWTIETALDLRVGALHARIALHGARVSVQFRSNSTELLNALQSSSSDLVAVLEESGLHVDRVQCMRGLPDEGVDMRTGQHFAAPLLDIRV